MTRRVVLFAPPGEMAERLTSQLQRLDWEIVRLDKVPGTSPQALGACELALATQPALADESACRWWYEVRQRRAAQGGVTAVVRDPADACDTDCGCPVVPAPRHLTEMRLLLSALITRV